MFEQTQYKAFFENSVTEEFEDFVYQISRGKMDEVLQMAEELQLKPDQELRPTGDNVMHVCAEYGQIRLFHHFFEKGGDLLSRNHVRSISDVRLSLG